MSEDVVVLEVGDADESATDSTELASEKCLGLGALICVALYSERPGAETEGENSLFRSHPIAEAIDVETCEDFRASQVFVPEYDIPVEGVDVIAGSSDESFMKVYDFGGYFFKAEKKCSEDEESSSDLMHFYKFWWSSILF